MAYRQTTLTDKEIPVRSAKDGEEPEINQQDHLECGSVQQQHAIVALITLRPPKTQNPDETMVLTRGYYQTLITDLAVLLRRRLFKSVGRNIKDSSEVLVLGELKRAPSRKLWDIGTCRLTSEKGKKRVSELLTGATKQAEAQAELLLRVNVAQPGVFLFVTSGPFAAYRAYMRTTTRKQLSFAASALVFVAQSQLDVGDDEEEEEEEEEGSSEQATIELPRRSDFSSESEWSDCGNIFSPAFLSGFEKTLISVFSKNAYSATYSAE
ncbi:unnamed protein product [Peniophora sp. CBMAI 1063]|nr:unnamed protein product [Peniophora sp. CBMAI 1063]